MVKKKVKAKVKKKSNKGGRPTKYKKEYLEQAFKLCLLGSTDKQLADFFNVTEKTLNNWKKDAKFLQSLKRGKEEADSRVQSSLYHRALGYSHPEEKIFCTDGNITRADTIKHYPPDTTAAIFWLKNRKSEEWRDKKEVEQSGAITHVHKVSEQVDFDAIRKKAENAQAIH